MMQAGVEQLPLGLYVIRGDNMYARNPFDLILLLFAYLVCFINFTLLMRLYLCCRAVVGEVDDELDSQIDLSQISAAPLKPLAH